MAKNKCRNSFFWGVRLPSDRDRSFWVFRSLSDRPKRFRAPSFPSETRPPRSLLSCLCPCQILAPTPELEASESFRGAESMVMKFHGNVRGEVRVNILALFASKPHIFMCGALKLSGIVRANVRLSIAIPMFFWSQGVFRGVFRVSSGCLQGVFIQGVFTGCSQGVFPYALSKYALWTLPRLLPRATYKRGSNAEYEH